MTVTALNQGTFEDGALAPSTGYHQVTSTAGERVGREAMAYNEDCDSYVTVVYGSASESLTAGNLCIAVEDFSFAAVDPGNVGKLAIAVNDMSSGDYGWFIVRGQARITSAALGSVSTALSLYLDSVAGTVDDEVVTGDLIVGMAAVEDDDTTAGVYTSNTAKCMLDYPYVTGVLGAS